MDIVRALAILFVLIGHCSDYLPIPYAAFIAAHVVDGVQVFFVLSGFLIGGILIKTLNERGATTSTLVNFWARRWWRTVPMYLLTLGALLMLQLVLIGSFDAMDAGKHLVFVQNLTRAPSDLFPESWSLAVEEWFYLIMPVFAFFLARKTSARRAVLITALLIIGGATSFRYLRYLQEPSLGHMDWYNRFSSPVVNRLDGLMFGVLGAYAAYYHQAFWLRWRKPALAAGMLIIAATALSTHDKTSVYTCVGIFTVTATGVLLCLPFLSQVSSGRGATYKALTHISLISYSAYLINFSIVHRFVIDDFLSSRLLHKIESPVIGVVVRQVLFWGLSIGGATLLYRFVERPMMRVRDAYTLRSRPARQAVPTAAAATLSVTIAGQPVQHTAVATDGE